MSESDSEAGEKAALDPSTGPSSRASRALRTMVNELRAEAPPELRWHDLERKLMAEVASRDAARLARASAAPRSTFLQALGFAAAAALIAFGISSAGSGSAPIAAAPVTPVAIDLAEIAAAPGDPSARDLAKLEVGDVVVTSDTAVTFRREGVVAFTLAPSSRMTVRSTGDARGIGTRLTLEQGALRAEVTPRPASEGLVEAFAVEVEGTRVAVHGTAFSVGRAADQIVVDVEHGTVAVGPTGHVGVTTGHILVGPTRASFSFDGGRVAHFLPRDPAPSAPVAIAAAPIATAAAPSVAEAAIERPDPAPVAIGVHLPQPARVATADVAAPRADVVATPKAIPTAAATLSEAVITARLRQCFERANAGDPGAAVAISVVSNLHIVLQADGSVKSAIFDPPLKPELMACAGSAIAGKFTDGERQIDLPVSFHAR